MRFDHTLPNERKDWRTQAFVLGAAAFVLGVLPAWATGRQIVFDFHSDRYALPAMFGASLLWIALITWFNPGRWQRSLWVTLVVTLAMGLQLQTANASRQLWKNEQRFFWQLAWRAPSLQPNTALLTYSEVFPNQGLFSLSAALNLLYPPQPTAKSLPYWWYTLTPRYRLGEISDPITLTFKTQFRSLGFRGASPNTLLVQYDLSHGSCLWVITADNAGEPGIEPLTSAMSKITNLSLILPTPSAGWQTPQELFGSEPPHDWCYYYEKADLARQQQDWSTLLSLAEQARKRGFAPTDSRSNAPHEWLPFIEAYAQTNQWAEAASLTQDAASLGREYEPMLAKLWARLANVPSTSAEKTPAVQQMNRLLTR